MLASNGDGTVHVLDSETGEDAAPALRGHTKAVGAIATVMLDGGTVVVTSGWDETVRSWQLETSAPLGGPWGGTRPLGTRARHRHMCGARPLR